MSVTICGEFQPNERYSRIRSSSLKPRYSRVLSPFIQKMAWCSTMIFGRAVVPEVQTMAPMSIGALRSGSCSASPGVSAQKNSSAGSRAPAADHWPKRIRGAGWSPIIRARSISL